MTETAIRVERDGPVTIARLSWPERRNAVDRATAAALADAFRQFDADACATVAVMHGDGGGCSAPGPTSRRSAPTQAMRVTDDGDGPMGPTRMRLSKPVIAAIAGHAVAGGLELALFCNLRVVERDAILGVFCRRWGVPLIDGGTVRLPQLIGLSHAPRTSSSPVARSARRRQRAMGLANRVVPTGRRPRPLPPDLPA